jgi:hypothetical protein
MTWTENDLKNLKAKGLKVDDKVNSNCGDIAIIKPKVKIEKRSLEKDTIHAILDMFKLTKLIDDYQTELKFDELRKFRFDYAIPSLKIAIEYEGVFSKKSRHTTVSGFSEDCIKYNLAVGLGWRVLRYTAKNYLDLEKDLNKML